VDFVWRDTLVGKCFYVEVLMSTFSKADIPASQ